MPYVYIHSLLHRLVKSLLTTVSCRVGQSNGLRILAFTGRVTAGAYILAGHLNDHILLLFPQSAIYTY